MCSMYEGMRNSSRGKIILGKDIANVRWGSSVTSVENANVQQPTAPQGVVEEADDGITLMDSTQIIRKHLVTAIIAFVGGGGRRERLYLPRSGEVYGYGSDHGYLQCFSKWCRH